MLTLLALASCQPRPTKGPETHLVARPVPPEPASNLARTQKVAPSAVGRGDFLLENGLVSATVLGLAHTQLAGGLAHPRSGTTPHQLGPLTPRLSARPMRFQRVYVTRGESASVRLEGAAAANGGLSVSLSYSLPRGSRKVHISLRLRRGLGALPWRGEVALRLALGATRAFVPGHGYTTRAPRCQPWVELHAPSSSYALSCAHGWRLRDDANGGIIASRVLTFRPGKTFHHQATLTIAGEGFSAALRPLLASSASATLARVHVLDERGEPLAHAVVDAWRNSRLEARGIAGKDGRVALGLPAGAYRLHAFSRGREAVSSLSLPPRGLRHTLRTGAPSQLVFDLRRDAQRREALQLRVRSTKGPSTPYLWGTRPLAGPDSWVAPTGRGVLPLPPGRYRLTVFRPFAPPRAHDLTLAPFRGSELLSRAHKRPQTRPPCRLLVDGVTASFFSAGDLSHWAEAAGCKGSGTPAGVFSRAPESFRQLLRAFGAPSPAWPRSARPGTDVRYVPRAFVLPFAGPAKEKRAPPSCVFYSEGPLLRAARHQNAPTLHVLLPPGLRFEKAVHLTGGKVKSLAPPKIRKTRSFSFVIGLGDARSSFGLSAKSPRGRRVFALMQLRPRCFLAPAPQRATPGKGSNPQFRSLQ